MIRAFAAMLVVYLCIGCTSSTTVSSASASTASAWPSGRGTTSPSPPTTTSDGTQPEPPTGCGLTPVYAAQTFVNLVEAGDRARYEKCEQDGFTVSTDTLRVIATHTWLLESARQHFRPGTCREDCMPHNVGVVRGGVTIDVPSLPAAGDTNGESTSTADRKRGLYVTVEQFGTEFFVTNVTQYSSF